VLKSGGFEEKLSTRAEPDLQYTFTCPSCSGKFSIGLEKIPPVQARFRCPHCQKPMDFPSRDEARVYAQLQQSGRPPDTPRASRETAATAAEDSGGGAPADSTRFQIQKSGFEKDVYDRRGMRNLIRTAALDESDLVRVDDAVAVKAGTLPYLKSLFALRKQARGTPPPCCRLHTEKMAFFQCNDTLRPLCEECAPEKKFGGTVIRVCQHCGGTAGEMPSA
jgi:predicted Zn finger-like uncharacterized protein